MRFDLLDEYSSIVPFGLGVPRRNNVVQSPGEADHIVKPSAIVARSTGHLERFLNLVGESAPRLAVGLRNLSHLRANARQSAP